MYVPNLDKETQRGATHTLTLDGGATLRPNLDKETDVVRPILCLKKLTYLRKPTWCDPYFASKS